MSNVVLYSSTNRFYTQVVGQVGVFWTTHATPISLTLIPNPVCKAAIILYTLNKQVGTRKQ